MYGGTIDKLLNIDRFFKAKVRWVYWIYSLPIGWNIIREYCPPIPRQLQIRPLDGFPIFAVLQFLQRLWGEYKCTVVVLCLPVCIWVGYSTWAMRLWREYKCIVVGLCLIVCLLGTYLLSHEALKRVQVYCSRSLFTSLSMGGTPPEPWWIVSTSPRGQETQNQPCRVQYFGLNFIWGRRKKNVKTAIPTKKREGKHILLYYRGTEDTKPTLPGSILRAKLYSGKTLKKTPKLLLLALFKHSIKRL